VPKKIGLYGGTFDPIHHAHLILAREAMEKLGLEQIIFIPAAISPHKLEQEPTPAPVRVEMLRAAIEGEPRFTLYELELRRPAPSYTFDTVAEFLRQDSERQIFYLIGSDNLAQLDTWHRIEELRGLVQFVVLNRGASAAHAEFPVVGRHIDISATEIRNRVASGRSIRYLVPPAVEEIIQRRQLYQEPHRSPQKN
jgi:nicotinate-nucleotide adenylyltransferase